MKPCLKNRSRAYYRYQRRRVIQRKTKIARQIGWKTNHAGKLAKGKVHCSCWMCSVKTKKDGYPHAQMVRLEQMNSQLSEYFSSQSANDHSKMNHC